MRKARVLITGANGFVGKRLTELLISSDYAVVPFVHKSCGLKDEIVVDFCSGSFLNELENLDEIDNVIHLGARAGWDCLSQEDMFGSNILATAILVNWSEKKGAHFIFSSAALIAGEKKEYIDKSSGDNPDSLYMKQKLLGENIVKISGLDFTILRIAGIFGSNGPPHLGINRSITGAINGDLPILSGDGNFRRNYVFIDDLCNTIRYCIELRKTGAFLIGGAFADSMKTMLTEICKVFLPGKSPVIKSGVEGHDQIVEHSSDLPVGRSFTKALEIMKESIGK